MLLASSRMRAACSACRPLPAHPPPLAHRHRPHQQAGKRGLGHVRAAGGDDSSSSSSGDSSAGGGQPDIDQLAAFLSSKAAEMRADMSGSLDELEMFMSAEEPSRLADEQAGSAADEGALGTADEQALSGGLAEPPGLAAPADAGLQADQLPQPLLTVDLLEETQDTSNREFLASDFAIVKLLGKLGMQDPASAPSGTSSPAGTAAPRDGDAAAAAASDDVPYIIVYAARYNSGLPYQGPVTVQLREYCTRASRRVAANELLAQRALCGPLPLEKWQAAAADPSRDCPVVRLLGRLEAPPSDDAFAATANPADTLWLVYKFEGLRPLALMLREIDLPEEPSGLAGLLMKKEAAVAAAIEGRYALLRAIAGQLLAALSFCHARGVAHGGLGPGSVWISSWADKEAPRLLVKLDNFGLARVYEAPLETPDGALASDASEAAAAAASQDLQAAGLLLAEVFMVGAAAAGAEVMDIGSLKRLLFDVFHEDIALFKEYCLQDEDNYAGFIDFMDVDGAAGWEFLGDLLRGSTGAGLLGRASRFLTCAAAGGSGGGG